MRPHRATLLRSSSFGLRIRKPGLPMPEAEWFEFSSFSPSAGIRSQIQEIRRKAIPNGWITAACQLWMQLKTYEVYEYGMSAKWLELLKEITPQVQRAAVLRDPAIASG